MCACVCACETMNIKDAICQIHLDYESLVCQWANWVEHQKFRQCELQHKTLENQPYLMSQRALAYSRFVAAHMCILYVIVILYWCLFACWFFVHVCVFFIGKDSAGVEDLKLKTWKWVFYGTFKMAFCGKQPKAHFSAFTRFHMPNLTARYM